MSRAGWQEIKRQLDAEFGKGFSDKCKTKAGDLLDKHEKLCAKMENEVKFLAKAMAEITASLDAILETRNDLNGARDQLIDYVKRAPNLDKTKQKAAVDFIDKAMFKIMGNLKNERYTAVRAVKQISQDANNAVQKASGG